MLKKVTCFLLILPYFSAKKIDGKIWRIFFSMAATNDE